MNPFQKTPEDESRCRTQPERAASLPETEEELERLLAVAGMPTAQRRMATLLGIDPSDTGPLDKAMAIICVPWSAPKLKGSVLYHCSSCRGPVAVSAPSHEALLARPELRALCLSCALKEQEERRRSGERP